MCCWFPIDFGGVSRLTVMIGGTLRQGMASRVSSGGISRARELFGSQKIVTDSSVLKDVAKRSLTRDEKAHLSSTQSLLLSVCVLQTQVFHVVACCRRESRCFASRRRMARHPSVVTVKRPPNWQRNYRKC